MKRYLTGDLPKERASSVPKVSIGMPIYNGENYLSEALDSILSQTYHDFELIICDNASTDNTSNICLEYVEHDKRIVYVRNEKNIGAARNYNKTFDISRGKYFKWASHDDKISSNALERCVEELEKDESIILAYPKTIFIDSKGQEISTRNQQLNFMSRSPWKRFFQLCVFVHKCNPVFGVIRSDYLRRTRLIDRFPHADRILLTELCLLGKFKVIPDAIFYRRLHPNSSLVKHTSSSERMLWYDPSYSGKFHHEYYRAFIEGFRSASCFSRSWKDKIFCYFFILIWALKRFTIEVLVKCKLIRSGAERDRARAAG
jgi:glycosyltransferase involved in cell wall biosynthesis